MLRCFDASTGSAQAGLFSTSRAVAARMIDSPRSPRVRAVAKLAKRDARSETGLFLLEGPQAVREAFAYSGEAVLELFATPTALERHPELGRAAAQAGVGVGFVTEGGVGAKGGTGGPPGG